MRRHGDQKDKTYFRSERLFCMNGQWYFCTREGDYGPYASRNIAERALKRFVGDKVDLDGFQKSRTHEQSVPRLTTLAERMAKVTNGRSRPRDSSELLF
jgi:hypothetical protein